MTSTPTTRTTLADIATPEGTFAVVAMDQRNTLKRMYAAVGIDAPTHEELVDIKADVISALGDTASAFLLDPTFGTPALDLVGDRESRTFGVLVAAEPEVRPKYGDEPRPARDPQLNGQWVLDQGGSAVKFLIQTRADRPHAEGEPDLVGEAMDVIRDVVEDCRAAGVPSVIENLIYPLPEEEPLTPERRADAIIEAAVAFDSLNPDLLKLEYPGSPEACRKLASSIKSPWAVLSAGVDFDVFTNVITVSCDEGGASGFIAGRSVWKDAVGMERSARQAYLADEGKRRLDGCLSAMEGRAVPWNQVSPK
ncbi:hypothetical protein [Solicola sp. PLA-1-18]|uniref:hypothetical protein n=1 Tax=Solicola sp. PLA-1-18 TaxID=3380532 RepID=UPI003B7B2DA6